MTKIAMLFSLACVAFGAGCGDDGAGGHDAAVPSDAASGDAAGPDASCFDNPTTHDQIINACTTAQKIYKDSHPPLLQPDGSLPPLP